MGVKVTDINESARKKYDISAASKGVVIVGVDQSFTDARAALKEGDIITEIRINGGEPAAITSVKDYDRVAGKIKHGDAVLLLVKRKGNTFFVAFTVKNRK